MQDIIEVLRFYSLNFMLFKSFMVKDINHEEREEFEGGKILRPLCLGGSPVRSAARMILLWRAPPRTADSTPEATDPTLWMIPFVGVGLLALLEVMAFDAVDPFVVHMLGM